MGLRCFVITCAEMEHRLEQQSRMQGCSSACRSAGIDEQDSATLLRHAQSEPCKQAVKKWTDESIRLGAYGFPFMHVQGPTVPDGSQMYFGSDRIEQIAMALQRPYLGLPNHKSRL